MPRTLITVTNGVSRSPSVGAKGRMDTCFYNTYMIVIRSSYLNLLKMTDEKRRSSILVAWALVGIAYIPVTQTMPYWLPFVYGHLLSSKLIPLSFDKELIPRIYISKEICCKSGRISNTGYLTLARWSQSGRYKSWQICFTERKQKGIDVTQSWAM